MSVATGDPIADIESRYDGAGYGQFKEDVGEAVVALLDPIRQRYEALRADARELQRLLAMGAEKARKESDPTLERCTTHGLRQVAERAPLRSRAAARPVEE